MAGELSILIQAALNKQLSEAKINADIKALQAQALKIGIEIDDKSAKKTIAEQKKYWQGMFQDQIKAQTTTSDIQKQQAKYYKDLENQSDSFNKKNLNGIDYEIKAREQAAKINSNAIKARMQAQAQADKQAENQSDAFNKKNLNGIDYEIKAREQAAKTNSNAIKAQMQAQVQADKQAEKAKNDNIKAANDNYDRLKAISKLNYDIDKYTKNNTRIGDDNKDLFLSKKLGLNSSKTELKQASAQIQDLKTKMADLGLEGLSAGDKLKNAFSKLSMWFSATAIIMQVVAAIKQMITNVQDLDKELVNIQMVTGGTHAQTEELIKTYNSMAKELGASTTEVTQSANEWLSNIGLLYGNIQQNLFNCWKPLRVI